MPRMKAAARPTEHDAALAQQIGQRIREARRRAGLTQQQLAGDRYTKAYVSALETGIARPSMVALSFLSERLGLPPSHFLDEQTPAWTRLEVDMNIFSTSNVLTSRHLFATVSERSFEMKILSIEWCSKEAQNVLVRRSSGSAPP